MNELAKGGVVMEMWGGPLDGAQRIIRQPLPTALLFPEAMVDTPFLESIKIRVIRYDLRMRWTPEKGNYWVYAYSSLFGTA
jgi:hypothetical protein